MDYKKIYDSLMLHAQNRTLEGYVEKHHIIPRCMKGTNERNNLVNLTPREHFLAHWLLVKIHPDNFKLLCAWNCFCRIKDVVRPLSIHYERCRVLWVAELHKRKITHPDSFAKPYRLLLYEF